MLSRGSAKSTLEKCLLESQNYKNCTLEAQLQIKARIESKIESNKEKKLFSLRDLEELITIYMNDHSQRINFIDSIDKTLHEMANLKQLISDKKKYGPQIAGLADLKFSDEIQKSLIRLQKKVTNSRDETNFDNGEEQDKFKNCYRDRFIEIVNNILNTRLTLLKAQFPEITMENIDNFMKSDEVLGLLEHHNITKKGFIEVIDQVLHRLDNYVIAQVTTTKMQGGIRDQAVINSSTNTVQARVKEAFDKKPSLCSHGRNFVSPEELEKMIEKEIKVSPFLKSSSTGQSSNRTKS